MLTTATKNQILLARVVVAIIIAFLIAGALTYGFSAEVRQRTWHDLLERPNEVMRFRFILQPVMAVIAALHDGVEDAKLGRSPYIWTLLNSAAERSGRLAEGLISTARILLLGLCMDTVYQLIVFKTFYPAQAVIVAIVLGFIPYLLLRGPIARIARWRRGGPSPDGSR
jgi:tryptophan-rich sensory protein